MQKCKNANVENIFVENKKLENGKKKKYSVKSAAFE